MTNSKGFTNTMLTLIAVFLGLLAFHEYSAPAIAKAQTQEVYPFYIEPGTRTLRAPDNSAQVLGKVVVDLRNGNIWGFPTSSPERYPIDVTGSSKTPTSKPFLLGKFDFAATNH